KLKCHDCHARAASPPARVHKNAAPPTRASTVPKTVKVRAGKRRAVSTSSPRDTLATVIVFPWGSWPPPAACARSSRGPSDRLRAGHGARPRHRGDRAGVRLDAALMTHRGEPADAMHDIVGIAREGGKGRKGGKGRTGSTHCALPPPRPHGAKTRPGSGAPT